MIECEPPDCADKDGQRILVIVEPTGVTVAADDAERRGASPRLLYLGQAGSGLNEDMIRQLTRLFAQLRIPESPFVNPPKLTLAWVQPLLVAEFANNDVTEARSVRRGLRPVRERCHW